ncbi:MAG: hypothetical protein J6J24_02025 [Clostridia bacterium]|nr:hypothetical protein [Clostridia bacterium]
MFKVFCVVFLIFGTVVGSGFSSGKEIMVFFSRFGVLSYLYVCIASVLFFFVFYFLLNFGRFVVKKIENSKLLNIITLFVSVVFGACMFAGIKSLFDYFPTWLYWIMLVFIVALSFVVVFKGVNWLEKVNLILMPLAGFLFLIVLIYSISISSDISISVSSWAGALYAPLYVTLNTSMSVMLISGVGEGLTKKQTFFASLFSSILLLFFLLLGNFVLQRNGDSFVSEMPFLNIVKDNSLMFCFAFIVVLVGCFTTLISLCFTIKSAMAKIIPKQNLVAFLSVTLPFVVGFLSFSQIVSNLYPICSVLGVFVLLFAIASFKQTDKIIHSKSKNTQNYRRRHY